jgi:glycerol-3-phosphate dehydrogenase
MLPGGDLSGWIDVSGRPEADIASFEQALAARHPELGPELCRRWSRSYGALVERILESGDLGREVARGLFEAELDYLRAHEWARSGDDVLWRRSKLGLHMSESERAAVAGWWTPQVGMRTN